MRNFHDGLPVAHRGGRNSIDSTDFSVPLTDAAGKDFNWISSTNVAAHPNGCKGLASKASVMIQT